MTANGTNVLTFVPRREEPPALTHCDVSLSADAGILALTLYADDGDCFVVNYALASAPPGFDIKRLEQAWANWRGTSAAAS